MIYHFNGIRLIQLSIEAHGGLEISRNLPFALCFNH
jgi:hypothetical protein